MSRADLLPPTAEDTVGPYYPIAFCDADRADAAGPPRGVVASPAGDPILLTGRVLDVHGDLVRPFLIEFSQADSQGRWLAPATLGDTAIDPHFTGHARQYAEDGMYRLRTVRPGAIAADGSGAERGPHITVTLFCDGLARVVTQVFFADTAANATDPLLLSLPGALRERLIATRSEDADGIAVYTRDIVLRGDGETPFFDDLES